MLFLWAFIILFVVFYWKQQQEQEICQPPVFSQPPKTQIQWTEPPEDWTIIDNKMNGSTITMKVGEKRKVVLSGNATTGYAWRIVKIDGTSVQPDEKWHYKLKFPVLTGSGGYFQREFEAIQPGVTDVYFIYDPVADPIRFGYYYFLRFDVRQ